MDRPEELDFAWLMLIGIGLTFLLSLAVVLFFVQYQRKLHAQHLAMEQLKVKEQKKRLEAVMAAQEQERSRIARDLHDEVGVMLSMVKLYLTMDVPNSTPEAPEPLTSKAVALLNDAVSTVRGIAQNLSAEHLQAFGLENAIKATVQPIQASGIEVKNSYEVDGRLAAATELHLHRMVQELVNNTVKHASASRIDISLSTNNNSTELRYTDNGRGFDTTTPQHSTGFGLTTLHGRAEIMRGELTLLSAPDKGVQVHVSVPRSTATPPSNGTEYNH